MKRQYCKHVMCRTCMQQCSHIGSACHASVVRGCVLLRASSSLIYHFWFLKHHHSATTPHHHRRWWRSCRTHENCMHAEQIIIIFYIFFFIFCSMYLVFFSIVLYRTIVTVYTDNIFLYNYLRQMHQIICLSPVGCFTPARGKTVQKNHEVSGVNKGHSVGTRAALGNCLPYNLDTANKLPMISVLTKQAGGKEIKFNARGSWGINIRFTTGRIDNV